MNKLSTSHPTNCFLLSSLPTKSKVSFSVSLPPFSFFFSSFQLKNQSLLTDIRCKKRLTTLHLKHQTYSLTLQLRQGHGRKPYQSCPCKFMAFFVANSCLRNANFFLVRPNSIIVPLFLISASVDFVFSGTDGDGSPWTNRNSFTIRIIWLKLGLILESSTQHDCIMKARSGGVASGITGLSCCIHKSQFLSVIPSK